MKVSLTKIREILRKCQFNPRKPGPMKIIADMDDAKYYRLRAIELISTAATDKQIQQAIGLLALYLAAGESNEKAKNRR